MQFLRDILGNKKKYFLQSEIIDVNVPLCPEITVERVLEQIKNIKEFMIYLPDLPEIGKSYIERGFVFAVVKLKNSLNGKVVMIITRGVMIVRISI